VVVDYLEIIIINKVVEDYLEILILKLVVDYLEILALNKVVEDYLEILIQIAQIQEVDYLEIHLEEDYLVTIQMIKIKIVAYSEILALYLEIQLQQIQIHCLEMLIPLTINKQACSAKQNQHHYLEIIILNQEDYLVIQL
jgi:hypothetical protein